MMPAAYGQHQDLRPFDRSHLSGVNFVPTQSQAHTIPGGVGQPSGFTGFAPAAPGFPVQQYQQPPVINPLPYNASSPYPTTVAQAPAPMPQPAYTTTASAYLPYNYNRRAHTTGSMYPPGQQQGVIMPPSTSYTVPFGAPPPQSKSNEEYSDDCFNIFWLFFLLGPLTWPCAMFGVCSEKHSERMAGFVSAVCLVLVVIAAIVIITQAPGDSDS